VHDFNSECVSECVKNSENLASRAVPGDPNTVPAFAPYRIIALAAGSKAKGDFLAFPAVFARKGWYFGGRGIPILRFTRSATAAFASRLNVKDAPSPVHREEINQPIV
jgi:hypothetical protein